MKLGNSLKKLLKSLKLNKFASFMKSKPVMIICLAIIGYFLFKRLNSCGAIEGFQSQPSTFENDVSNGKKLVWFYADWCGHCKSMQSEWDKASKNVNGKMVKVNLGDGENADVKKISDTYGIQSFPTILLLENGQKKEEYSGQRKASDFESFVNENIN